MDLTVQNWIVYGIVAVVTYLLFGSTLQWAFRKILGTPDEKSQVSEYLGIYRSACKDCTLPTKNKG